jgi:hypothetical protein
MDLTKIIDTDNNEDGDRNQKEGPGLQILQSTGPASGEVTSAYNGQRRTWGYWWSWNIIYKLARTLEMM